MIVNLGSGPKPLVLIFAPTSPSILMSNHGFVLVVLQITYGSWQSKDVIICSETILKHFIGPLLEVTLVFAHALLVLHKVLTTNAPF
jgi:hypothetical protein